MNDIFKDNNIRLPSIDEADGMENPLVVAHFRRGDWDWYVIGGDSVGGDDFELFCLVDGFVVELGMVMLSELLGVGAVLDCDWVPRGLYEVKSEIGW